MPAHDKTAAFASSAVYGTVALALPASIVFGRAALAVTLGLAVLAMAAATAAGRRWPVWPQPLRAPLVLAGLVVVAWLPTVVASLEPAVSTTTLLRSVVTVAGGAVLAAFLVQDQRLTAWRLFVAGMLAAELFAAAALYVSPSLTAFRANHDGIAVPHMTLKASASAIACALPLLLFAGWRLGGWWRGAVALCIPLSLAIMYGTVSRSSLAGLLAALAVCAVVAVTRAGGLRRLAVALALLAALGGAGLGIALRSTPDLRVGGYALFAPIWLVDQHRQVIWQFTLDRFRERPWFGWGPNVINDVPGAGAMIPELQGEYIPSHPHNWMVESLAESGIAGFVPLLAVIVGIAAAAACNSRRHGGPAHLAWLAVWLTYWSAGAFNFSMWNSSWQASGMLLGALIWAEIGREKQP